MAARPRVHEISAEFGVDSKVVVRALKELGETVKGPSSTVVPPVARQVRALLASGWVPGDSVPNEKWAKRPSAPTAPRPGTTSKAETVVGARAISPGSGKSGGEEVDEFVLVGVVSVTKAATRFKISSKIAVSIINDHLESPNVTYLHSTLPPEVVRQLERYVAKHPEVLAQADAERAARGTKRGRPKSAKKRRGEGQTSEGHPSAASQVPEGSRWKCPACAQVVDFGLVTDTVLSHEDRAGSKCSGSGLARLATQIVQPEKPRGEVTKKKKKTKTTKPRKGEKAIGVSKSNGARGDKRKRADTSRASQLIRRSEKEERSVRRAAYEDEFGGRNSVRSWSGGLPGQGRGG